MKLNNQVLKVKLARVNESILFEVEKMIVLHSIFIKKKHQPAS